MMNTVRKSENLLPFPVISAAANGDTTAMCAILKHYEGYIVFASGVTNRQMSGVCSQK